MVQDQVVVTPAHPEVELLEREDILALQREKLANLGRRLARCPEWKEHFGKVGLSPSDLSDPTALTSVPTMEKTDLRERYPFPMLTVDPQEAARFFATSGTTGPPVLFGFTRRDYEILLAGQMVRLLATFGVQPDDRTYQGYGYGLWIGGAAFDLGLSRVGATVFPLGPGRGELAVEWLRDQAYTVATMSPLWLMTLAGLAKSQGIDPKKDWTLRVGILGGQSISTGFRDQIEAEMPDGFLAHNVYGTTEAGGPILGASCAFSHDQDCMHLINEDTVLTEILDPKTMKPAEPGEIGEIVVTTLDKEASPVVRWRTRDLVRLAEKPYDCPCGRRGLPLVGRIIGRSDDMLKIRGVIVFPSQVEDVLAGIKGTVKEAWQIYVDRDGPTLEEATVAIERTRGANQTNEQLAESLGQALRARLGLRLSVECHEEGTLPRYEAKAQRVLVREQMPNSPS